MDASLRLLVKVAYLYYVAGQRQETIGQSLNLSRSTISRMLADARDRGIVEITINYPAQTNVHLERRLEETFGLLEALVVPDTLGLPAGAGQQVANAAAMYLTRILRAGGILGVSGGSTLAQVVRALHGSRHDDLTVVQLIGQTVFGQGSANAMLNDYDVTRGFAQVLGARYQLLLAPAFTEHEAIGEALRAEPMVKQTLETGRRANVAIVGIGALDTSSHLVHAGLLTSADLERLASDGAVGEIGTRFFDIKGRPCGAAFEQRAIGVSLVDLRNCPLVIGVAYGDHKVRSILAALRGGYIKVLVTDETTAAQVLSLHDANGAAGVSATG